MKRTCEACGQSFEAKTSRRKYCDRQVCKRKRDKLRKRRGPADNVAEFPTHPHPLGEFSVTEATRAELEAAGKLESSIGRAALALARRLDDPNDDTGSSMAGVAKQLRALMVEAMKDAQVAHDPVDEIRAQREKRLRRRRGA